MTNQEAIKIFGLYDVSDLHFYNTDGEEIPFTEWSDAIDLAISALEKQIPKKPVIGYAFPSKLREVMKRTDPENAETKTDCCPVCGRTLGVSKFVQTQSGLRVGDPHCKRCGQAIDWSEEG